MRIQHTTRRLLLASAAISPLCFGCSQGEESGADRYLPDSTSVVTAYGLTLDEQASARQTAWALLMAARDDTRQRVNSPQWQEIMKLECQLANVEMLRSALTSKLKSPKSEIDDFIFKHIRNWAAMLNYYAEFFDDDFESAKQRMRVRAGVDPGLPAAYQATQVVNYVIAGADQDQASGPPRGATIAIVLATTEPGYWRVYNVRVGPPPGATQPRPEKLERDDDSEETP